MSLGSGVYERIVKSNLSGMEGLKHAAKTTPAGKRLLALLDGLPVTTEQRNELADSIVQFARTTGTKVSFLALLSVESPDDSVIELKPRLAFKQTKMLSVGKKTS